jgi:hypothetical protein
LAAENFWPYIAKSEVPLEEPGHLSAVTVAKGIEYGVVRREIGKEQRWKSSTEKE